jgi:hypothetical protein
MTPNLCAASLMSSTPAIVHAIDTYFLLRQSGFRQNDFQAGSCQTSFTDAFDLLLFRDRLSDASLTFAAPPQIARRMEFNLIQSARGMLPVWVGRECTVHHRLGTRYPNNFRGPWKAAGWKVERKNPENPYTFVEL